MSNENNNPFEQPQENNQQYYQAPPQQSQGYNTNMPPMPMQEEKASVGLAILSYIIPLVGLILYLTKKDSRPKTAKVCGKCALASFIINIVITIIMYAVMGAAMFSGLTGDSDTGTESSYSELDADSKDNADSEKDTAKQPNDGTIGDYKCVVKSAVKCKDYAGKDAILITYDFTNNSDDAISFDIALDTSVFQGGVELETAILDEETDLLDTAEIKPGITKEVKKAYLLRDASTELEVEISELISFSDDKIVTKVTLQ